MYITAVALMLICAGYFVVFRRQFAGPLIFILLAGFAAGMRLPREIHRDYQFVIEKFRGNSHFGQLQVLDARDGSCRYYLNDFLTQNTYDPERKQSLSHFTYMLSGLARAYTTNIHDVLCIGLGIGIVPMDFAREGARGEVVEINPAIVPGATQFFDLHPEKLNLTIDDGRHLLNRCQRKYDVVILDAFLGDSSPSHLLTREAFSAIRRVLRSGGTLVINAFGDLEPGRDFFTASLDKTLKAVFQGVRLHTNGDGGMFFVATDRSQLTFVRPPNLEGTHPDVRHDTEAAYAGLVETPIDHGRILTDKYNPAEFYDARNREILRRKLAMAAKEM